MCKIPNIDSLSKEDILSFDEGQYFDRKSAGIKPKKLAESIVAFANADGGVIAIGVHNGVIEGIKEQGNIKINNFVQSKIDNCIPAVHVREKYLNVNNVMSVEDHILLLEINPSSNQVYKTASDSVYLRVGDENKKLTLEQRLDLEYDKGERLFEEQTVPTCNIDDLDNDLLMLYCEAVGYTGDDLLQPLNARGFIVQQGNKRSLTVAGVLMFAENPTRFFPGARIRFMRYEGSSEEVGVEMNIVKQEYIEGPLPKVIDQAKNILNAQLRNFTGLDPIKGKFMTVPEYPEFAWLEGIVNAITHRAYNIQGDDIKIKMFDDRLEISSPGCFPSIVNKSNIKEVRYSRNPRIARALTEMGWVRELGEGVKRIYREMHRLFLNDPEYTELQNGVLLTLKNNIVMRRMRKHERIDTLISKEWSSLTKEEQVAVEFLYSRGKLTTRRFSELIDRGSNYAQKTLKHLCDLDILEVKRTSKNDPNQHYVLKTEN